MLGCTKRDLIHPLSVPLWLCVAGIHQECIHIYNPRRDSQLGTCCSAAGCVLTSVIDVVKVVRAIQSLRFALTWYLSDGQHCSFATPQEHGAMWWRKTWPVARVYDCPCCQLWNYEIHQYTYSGYLPDHKLWSWQIPEYLMAGGKVDVSRSLVAFDSLCWIWTAYPTFHTLWYRKKILIVCPKGINDLNTLCIGFKVVKIIKLCCVVPWWLHRMGIDLNDLYLNLVPVWACKIQRGQLVQHTSFNISFVRASNAVDHMLFCYIAVFQYITIICQCGASGNPFTTRHVA